MKKKISIDFEDFKKNYINKESQLIFLKLKSESINLLNSFMKISEDHENSFLFESLKDGDLNGRYSVIGIKPDKILKIRKKASKIYDGKNIVETVNKEPIEAIRYFVNDSLIKITEDIPSIASGIFGYIGYDFVANIEKKATLDEINNAFEKASSSYLNGYLGIAHDGAVSMDLLGNPNSAIYDPFGTSVISDNFIKIVAWYDNEYGYSSRVIDLTVKIGSMLWIKRK